MKKISEHLGEILIALAGVTLLISVITFYKAPIGGFLNAIFDTELKLGNEMVQSANPGDLIFKEGDFGAVDKAFTVNIAVNGAQTLEAEHSVYYTGKDHLVEISANPASAITYKVNGVARAGALSFTSPGTYEIEYSVDAVEGYKATSGKFMFSIGGITHNGTIPEGGTYYVGVTSTTLGDYTGATATYTSGDTFPGAVNEGDIYVYGDYEYRYNMEMGHVVVDEPSGMSQDAWVSSSIKSSYPGWGVRVLDYMKDEYGDILTTINSENLTNMNRAFDGCLDMTSAPVIPYTVISLKGTYAYCEDLLVAPVIPNDVRIMATTFQYCSRLTAESAIVIPSNVTTMLSTFESCVRLSGTIEVNANPARSGQCFEGAGMGYTITLTGSCSDETKAKLADTASYGNVVY